MIIGTAGHIDHGKTALVRALTGVDTDRLPEEKRRGITIELGFAPLDLGDVGVAGVVDVPGHEGFIRTMVAGATGVDVALLIVAADEGVMPQTREHLTILRLLNVPSLVVALTKADLADHDWLALVRDDVTAVLDETPYRQAPIIATSVRDGRGLEDLKRAIADAVRHIGARSRDDLFRMPIDRAFSVKGTGTVVTGTAWTGTIAEGESMRVYPRDRVVRVRGIQSHGASVRRAGAGDRAAVAIAGVDLEDVARGSQLVSEVPWRSTTLLHAHVARLTDAAPWRAREWLRLHVGTSEVGARVVARAFDESTGLEGLARIVLDSPLLLRAGDRFVLRRAQPLSTVGGGIVTDPTPLRKRTRPVIPWQAPADERLHHVVAESGMDGLPIEDVPIRLGMPPAAIAALVVQAGTVVQLGSRIYLKEILNGLSEAIVNALVAYQRLHPLSPGMPLANARLRGANTQVTDAVISGLIAQRMVESSEGLLRTPGWSPLVSGNDEGHLSWVRARLKEAGKEPPSVAELRSGINGNDPIPVLRILERDGIVVQVEPDRFYDAGVVAGMMQQLRDGMRDGGAYAPAQLRELLGVSRKYLMPFLEYCDRRHVTERHENGRVLGRQEAR